MYTIQIIDGATLDWIEPRWALCVTCRIDKSQRIIEDITVPIVCLWIVLARHDDVSRDKSTQFRQIVACSIVHQAIGAAVERLPREAEVGQLRQGVATANLAIRPTTYNKNADPRMRVRALDKPRAGVGVPGSHLKGGEEEIFALRP